MRGIYVPSSCGLLRDPTETPTDRKFSSTGTVVVTRLSSPPYSLTRDGSLYLGESSTLSCSDPSGRGSLGPQCSDEHLVVETRTSSLVRDTRTRTTRTRTVLPSVTPYGWNHRSFGAPERSFRLESREEDPLCLGLPDLTQDPSVQD